MRCDEARLAASLRFDGELAVGDGPSGLNDTAALDDHIARCPDCADFERHLQRVRTALRFEPVDAAPDVASAVVGQLADEHAVDIGAMTPVTTASSGRGPQPRRPLLVAAGVAAVAGMAAGAVFVGFGAEPQSPAAADVPERVVAAQAGVDSLDARFTLVERGLGGTGDTEGTLTGERSFDGRLVYEAPESLALTLTAPPGDEPDVQLVVDGDQWWQSTPRECSPAAGRASCPEGDDDRWVRSVAGREPFSDSAPVPLELVGPVDSFTLAAAPAGLGTRTIADRSAVGVRVPAAQIGPFLDGLSPGGDLRPAYPSDPVEMWLDEEHLVPLEVVVRAGEDPHRARWAATQGVTERPGDIVVAFTVTSVAINDAAPAGALGAPDEPAPDEHIDAGFRRADAGDGEDGGAADFVAPAPRELPAGFEPYRAGITTGTGGPTIAVRSWTDGRAWLTVRATTEWSGGRLFGGLGTSVRRVDLGDAGVGYASEAGDMVALHADGLDVVVSGSVLPDDLQAAAASLGVTGRPVPATWDEAATATLDQAALGTDRLLVAADLDGFGSPAVRTGGDTTTQVYPGPGDRGFTLVQSETPHLTPPADRDTVGVDVRGVPGRYSPERGQLEWIEAGAAHSLSSPTLSLDELLAIAARLEPR